MQYYPKVQIFFCTGCKWNLRGAWYLQELLQTFGSDLGEVSLVPSTPGNFKIEVQTSADQQVETLMDRKVDGFLDAKIVKQRLRDVINPDKSLGHIDKHECKKC